MKKLLSLILILAMLTFSMVSCNKEETTDPTTETLAPSTPETPIVPETRYTVTAEEWIAAMDLTNYTATSSHSETYNVNGEVTSGEYTVEMIATDEVVFVKTTSEDTVSKMYYIFDDGVTYCVSEKSDGTLGYVSTDPYNYYRNFGTSFDCGSISFDSLSYNETAKAYTCSIPGEDGAVMNYAFYFVDGKLTKLVATASLDYSDGVSRISVEMAAAVIVSNHGTATLTVPEFERPGT